MNNCGIKAHQIKPHMLYNEKFKNLVLYILENDHYREEGIKKLNKLLYFIDFYFYRKFERSISGAQYAKAPMGPIVEKYKEIFLDLEHKGVLKQEDMIGQIIFRPKQKVDVSVFSSEEVDHVRDVLEKYGKLSSTELESISHEQQPWILTENYGDIIDPDLALLIADQPEEEIEGENETLKKELVELANSVF